MAETVEAVGQNFFNATASVKYATASVKYATANVKIKKPFFCILSSCFIVNSVFKKC